MTEPEKILELKENMEQALDKLKRAISARNSWNGSGSITKIRRSRRKRQSAQFNRW